MLQTTQFHDVSLAYKHREAKAIAYGFAERGQVRVDAVAVMGTANSETHSGDHFVKDKDSAFPPSDFAQLFEKIVAGLLVLDRLQDECCDLPWISLIERLHARNVVVSEPDSKAAVFVRYSRIHRGGANKPIMDSEERMVDTCRDIFPA